MGDYIDFILKLWVHIKFFASHYYPVVIKWGIALIFLKVPCSFLVDFLKKKFKTTSIYNKFLKKFFEDELAIEKIITKQYNKGRQIEIIPDDKGNVKKIIIVKQDKTKFTAYKKK